MLSIDKCKKILSQNGNHYSTEQVKMILEFLQVIGSLDYHYFTNSNKLQNEERNNLYEGINRRTEN